MTNIKNWQDRLLEDQTLPSNAKFIGITLSRFFGKSKLIFPSLRTICDLTSNTMNTTRRAINILKEKHYIVVEKEKIKYRGGYKNHYKLFLDGEQVSKNAISKDTLIDMLNDMSIDMLIDMLKTHTEYTEYTEVLKKEKNFKKFEENEVGNLLKKYIIDFFGRDVFKQWFSKLKVEEKEKKIYLITETSFMKNFIEVNYLSCLNRNLKQELKKDYREIKLKKRGKE